MKRDEFEKEINIKAWKEPEFKKKLLNDPRLALSEIGMKNVPNQLKIQIYEEDDKTWVLVLHKSPLKSKEASKQDLEKIDAAELENPGCSGGGTGFFGLF